MVKYLLGEASADEVQEVQEWMTGDAANRNYFDHFTLIWEASKQMAATSTVDENKAWERFQQRVKNGGKKTQVVKMKNTWLKVAAVIFLVMAGAITYLLFQQKDTTHQLIAQATLEVLTDTLPDGSVVTLNKESSLTYPSTFKGDSRSVALQGEAFFNVTPDRSHPFTIKINDVQVTVVGTSFNIKSRKGQTEVIVETGIVRVSRYGSAVELKPGEKVHIATADSSAIIKEEVSDKLYNYYRTKEFVCDDTPLWKLVNVLNDAYDAHIVIGREDLKNLRLTSPFYNESLEQVLEVISITFNIKVTRKASEIILE